MQTAAGSHGVSEVREAARRERLRCAHNCRSIERRRFSRAGIPLPDSLGCTGWQRTVRFRPQHAHSCYSVAQRRFL